MRIALLAPLVLLPLQTPAAPVPLDLTAVRPGPISVTRTEATVTVAWPDETARIWRALGRPKSGPPLFDPQVLRKVEQDAARATPGTKPNLGTGSTIDEARSPSPRSSRAWT